MSLRYVPALDGLRGVAVLLVVCLHYDYLKVGWIGVQFFFVLSGYLITRILLADRERPLGAYLRRFYTRRVLRIFPLYYGYLLALGAVALFFVGAPTTFERYAPWLFSYAYNYTRLAADWQHSYFVTHFWSLSVEEQFYLFWPLVVFFLPRRILKPTILILLVAGPLIRWWLATALSASGLDHLATGDALYWFTFCQVDAFAAGAAIPVFALDQRLGTRRGLLRVLALAWVAVGIVHLLSMRATGHDMPWTSFGFPQPLGENLQHVWGYSMIDIAAAATILLLLLRDPWLRAFEMPWLIEVGKISYGMYVLHWPVLALLRRGWTWDPATPRGIAIFGVYLVLLFAVSWFSFRFFESRFLRLKDRWAR